MIARRSFWGRGSDRVTSGDRLGVGSNPNLKWVLGRRGLLGDNLRTDRRKHHFEDT